jgi:hypothetical protein
MELIAIVVVVIAAYFVVKRFNSSRSSRPGPDGISIEVHVTSETSPSQFTDDQEQGPPDLYYFPVESTPRRVTARLKLSYVSTSGNQTEREIDVRDYYRGQDGCHFAGFDHLQKAYRKLSSKCVKDAIDLETGESLDDLVTFFERKYRESPEYLYDHLFEKHGGEIYIFVYLAAVDGAMRAPERNIITRYCLEQKGFTSLEAGKVDEILKKMYRPSKHDFYKCVRNSELAPTALNKVLSVANRMVGTNAKPHSEHTKALEYMKKQWKQKLMALANPAASA